MTKLKKSEVVETFVMPLENESSSDHGSILSLDYFIDLRHQMAQRRITLQLDRSKSTASLGSSGLPVMIVTYRL